MSGRSIKSVSLVISLRYCFSHPWNFAPRARPWTLGSCTFCVIIVWTTDDAGAEHKLHIRLLATITNLYSTTMNVLHSTLNVWRDKLAPISHTSTFRDTGQITPDEFVLAGDYLVYKFPSWSWADAATPAKRVPHLPVGKQFLVTRGVPCHRQLDDNFAGDSGKEDTVVDGMEDDEGDGWLRTGSSTSDNHVAKVRDVRTVDESGNVNAGEQDDDEEIPDMEDDDDEAIIRDGGKESTSAYA